MKRHWLMRARVALAINAAAALFFVAVWIVIPAPVYALLTFSVGAPEVSHWLLLFAVLSAALALVDVRRSRAARIALALDVAAFVLAAIPFMQLSSTTRRFDAAMRAAIGDGVVPSSSMLRGVARRPKPVVFGDLFRGLPNESVRIARGVPFAEPDGARLTMDIYRQAASATALAGAPILVQIYGGAWQRGAPADNEQFASYMAAHGYIVFAIDYRHAPRWRWPAQRDDVRSALAWIRSHAAAYGADTGRIVLIGRSAGAHLALIAAYDSTLPPVRAVVSYYGPVDLAQSYQSPPSPDPIGTRATEETFLGAPLDRLPERYREASPITYVTRRLPPTLIIVGARDHIVEPKYGALLDAHLRATGNTSVVLDIPWADHAFDAVPNGPSAQIALYYTERFLAWAER